LAIFIKVANHTGVQVNFIDAKFQGEAVFSDADFRGDTDFSRSKFQGDVDFRVTKFQETTNFSQASFLGKVNFSNNEFRRETFFVLVVFEQPSRVLFNDNNLSNVSFADTEITRIRVGDKIIWGENQSDFSIIEEKWLSQTAKGEEVGRDVSLDLVLSILRNLRENYEFRLRYDEGGKLFRKEMEVKRKYRYKPSVYRLKLKLITLGRKLKLYHGVPPKIEYKIIENSWLRRHFSLIGLYFHLSDYGESVTKPTLTGIVTIFLSTLFWLTQSNPHSEPHFQLIDNSTSHFIGMYQSGNLTHWLKSFERSLGDFLPLLSLQGGIQIGIVDYIIKIVGGALTFGLLIIALRRKFERKYTR
jgi:hypothetical protein